METHTVFMNWKTQHSKDVNIPPIDIEGKCNFSQNPEKTVHRNRLNYSKVYVEKQRN